MAKAEILIVEDDGIVAKDIQNRVKDLGFEAPFKVPSGEEAIEKIKERKPDLVLMDIMLKGEMDGIEAAGQIRSRFHIPVVYLTAYADEKTLDAAKLTEPFGYLMKPFEDKELKAVIEIALYRYKMEMKLKESEERFRTIFENAPVLIDSFDKDGRCILWNKECEKKFGWTIEEINACDNPLSLFYPDIDMQEQVRGSVTLTPEGVFREWHPMTKDGSKLVTLWANFRSPDETIINLGYDITENRKAEEALRDTNVQLQSLANRLEEMDESHRRRTAKELHDRTAQNLSAVSINLSMIKLLLPPEEIAKVDQRLEDSQELLNDAVMHIRDVMAELHPAILDDYGLMAALRWLGDQFSERTGVHAVVTGEDLSSKLPQKKERAMFRIAQESLMNIAKHSMASEVIVALEEVNGSVRLVISDDGVGFDTEVVKSSKKPHWGLAIMKERIIAVQGELNVESMPEKGTRIIAELRK